MNNSLFECKHSDLAFGSEFPSTGLGLREPASPEVEI